MKISLARVIINRRRLAEEEIEVAVEDNAVVSSEILSLGVASDNDQLHWFFRRNIIKQCHFQEGNIDQKRK